MPNPYIKEIKVSLQRLVKTFDISGCGTPSCESHAAEVNRCKFIGAAARLSSWANVGTSSFSPVLTTILAEGSRSPVSEPRYPRPGPQSPGVPGQAQFRSPYGHPCRMAVRLAQQGRHRQRDPNKRPARFFPRSGDLRGPNSRRQRN